MWSNLSPSCLTSSSSSSSSSSQQGAGRQTAAPVPGALGFLGSSNANPLWWLPCQMWNFGSFMEHMGVSAWGWGGAPHWGVLMGEMLLGLGVSWRSSHSASTHKVPPTLSCCWACLPGGQVARQLKPVLPAASSVGAPAALACRAGGVQPVPPLTPVPRVYSGKTSGSAAQPERRRSVCTCVFLHCLTGCFRRPFLWHYGRGPHSWGRGESHRPLPPPTVLILRIFSSLPSLPLV